VKLGPGVMGCAEPNDRGTCEMGCPYCVCAAWDTPIDTPDGPVAISLIDVGDLVYSIHQGEVVAVPVVRTNSTAVENHELVQVVYENGAVVEMSPGHPTADGRRFEDIVAGEPGIAEVRMVPYGHGFTFDILPDSDTGVYFSGENPIGSTLHLGGNNL
jgi:hypothetical protein